MTTGYIKTACTNQTLLASKTRLFLKQERKRARVPSDISVYLPACGGSQRNTSTADSVSSSLLNTAGKLSDRYTAAFRENKSRL